MKKTSTLLQLTVCIILTSFTVISCKKSDAIDSKPKPELVIGHWNINRIQWKVYYGGVFSRDSILKQVFLPENYIEFGAGGSFKYNFNTSTPEVGTYSWGGSDSLICPTNKTTHKWQVLTLIGPDLFTLKDNTTSPAFPGATIEEYYTLVQAK